MVTDLLLPQLDMSMTEGELTEWLVEDGARVIAGQAVYSIGAEKTVQEINAPAPGILRRIGTEGRTYPVGAKIGEIA